MKNDKYLKFILTVIAVCLLLLVCKSFIPSNLVIFGNAQAQTKSSTIEPKLELKEIKTLKIKSLESVIPLDNQRTFVAVTKDGLTVFRLEYVEK